VPGFLPAGLPDWPGWKRVSRRGLSSSSMVLASVDSETESEHNRNSQHESSVLEK
jgi:hypothetical protein